MSLRPNSYQEAVERMRAAQRRKAARTPASRKPSATLGAGRKTKEWQAAWRELKPRFERAGITFCELRRRDDCAGHNYLTPAHSKKRRNITTPEELREVIIACAACHQAIEILPESEMTEIVRQTISNRPHPI